MMIFVVLLWMVSRQPIPFVMSGAKTEHRFEVLPDKNWTWDSDLISAGDALDATQPTSFCLSLIQKQLFIHIDLVFLQERGHTVLLETEFKKVSRTSAFSVLLVTYSLLLFNSRIFWFCLLFPYLKNPFFVVFVKSDQFQFELRFCFSNCIFACTGNAFIVLHVYLFSICGILFFWF